MAAVVMIMICGVRFLKDNIELERQQAIRDIMVKRDIARWLQVQVLLMLPIELIIIIEIIIIIDIIMIIEIIIIIDIIMIMIMMTIIRLDWQRLRLGTEWKQKAEKR